MIRSRSNVRAEPSRSTPPPELKATSYPASSQVESEPDVGSTLRLRPPPKHQRKGLLGPKVTERVKAETSATRGQTEAGVKSRREGCMKKRTRMRPLQGKKEEEAPSAASAGRTCRRESPVELQGVQGRRSEVEGHGDFHATDAAALCLSFPPVSRGTAFRGPHAGQEHPSTRGWSHSAGDTGLTRVEGRLPNAQGHPQP